MNKKKVVKNEVIRDKQFWLTVSMFVVAAVLIVATIFLVRETNRLGSITESYSETFVDTAEDISAAAADIEEATAGLSEVTSQLQDINTHLEAIDENAAETVEALVQLENTMEEVGEATVEALDAVADLKLDMARILSSFEYMTFYWCHYCTPCE